MGRSILRKKIKLDVYACTVHFRLSHDLEKDVDRVYRKYDRSYPEDDGQDEALVFNHDISDYYLFIDSNYLSYNTVAHEIYHLVSRILKDRAIHDEEAGAWLCGMFMDVAQSFFFKPQTPKKPCGQTDSQSSLS